jgi:hypothetical protein
MSEPNPVLLMGAGGSKVQAQSLFLLFFFNYYFLFIHNFDYEFENLTIGLIQAIALLI